MNELDKESTQRISELTADITELKEQLQTAVDGATHQAELANAFKEGARISGVFKGANTSQLEKAYKEMVGVFGMPQLNKLDIHLKCPEYKDKANISVMNGTRNGAETPTGIHFENEKGDFKNDYRFMNAEIINEKLKTVKFKGVK